MKLKIFFLIVVASLSITKINYAQVDTLQSPMMKVVLSDSSVYWGRIISSNALSILLKDKSGTEIKISKKNIKDIFRAQDLPKETKLLTAPAQSNTPPLRDKNAYRLFLFPTAFPIKHGEGFSSLHQIFFPSVGLGIGNIVSIIGGTSLLPFVFPQYFISAKGTITNSSNFALAGGLLAGSLSEFGNNKKPSWFAYTCSSFGSENSNITAGIGISLSDQSKNGLLFVVGAQHQISNGGKLLAELWIPSQELPFTKNAAIVFGFRTFTSNFGWEAGLGKVLAERGSILPWLSFTVNFNLFAEKE